MNRILLLLVTIFVAVFQSWAVAPKAIFSAKECQKIVYYNGFDTDADFASWTVKTTNSAATWQLESKPRVTGISAFSSINPKSTKSLAVWYDDAGYAAQNESITSTEMIIPEGGKCSFFACFDGVYVMYADLKLIVTTEDNTKTTVFDAFLWSQDSGHERPKWLPFSIDLAQFAGKKVTFTFEYAGRGGDDVLIDDFTILANDTSNESKVEINVGDEVHFIDASEGEPTSWAWTFEGTDVGGSDEQNPVIQYSTVGTFKVTLNVKNADGENSVTREGFVTVKGVAPTAKIGFPDEGYLSPWVACFIPIETPITFEDKSNGFPTSWKWSLPGSSSELSTEQHPTVSYAKAGTYDVSLWSTNSVGTHSEIIPGALQAGGKQNIWNIEMSETGDLAPIQLGFYGNYGGSNWLDMPGFGEYFKKPIVKSEISKVDVYFASIESISPDAPITVAITNSKNGLPGDVLASKVLKVSELKYDESTFVPTTFEFDVPVEVSEDFFVTIIGFPNNSNDTGSDNIAMFCSPRREDGGKSTVYNYLAILDDKYQPTGEFEWMKNTDEFLSFAISPVLEYKPLGSVSAIESDGVDCKITMCDGMVKVISTANVENITIFNISGQMIKSVASVNEVSASDLNSGIYVVKAIAGGKQFVAKVIK